jgi:hypothetical protein
VLYEWRGLFGVAGERSAVGGGGWGGWAVKLGGSIFVFVFPSCGGNNFNIYSTRCPKFDNLGSAYCAEFERGQSCCGGWVDDEDEFICCDAHNEQD